MPDKKNFTTKTTRKEKNQKQQYKREPIKQISNKNIMEYLNGLVELFNKWGFRAFLDNWSGRGVGRGRGHDRSIFQEAFAYDKTVDVHASVG